MAIVPDQVDTIVKKAWAINKKVEVPPMPVFVYCGELNDYLGQMEKDQQRWIDAGFDWSTKAVGDTLLSIIQDTQAEVVVKRKDKKVPVDRWLNEKAKVDKEYQLLFTVNKFVYSGDSNGEASLSEIAAGTTNMESVQNILTLIKMATPKIDQISKLRIDNTTIDKNYLDTIKTWADDLSAALGQADAFRKDKLVEIELRNRVIMLSQDYLEEIRRWVPVVYFNNPSLQAKFSSTYFNKKYIPKAPKTPTKPAVAS
jgi:hypothetical protein